MTKLIKKYKNRRLYDTEKSRYITIEDVKKYVVDGVEFSVQDAKTKDDLTNNTLLQILFESGSNNSAPFFSTNLLRQLITLANHPLNKSMQSLLENIVNSISKSTIDANYKKQLEEASAAWNQQMSDLTAYWKDLFDTRKK